jgi:hypothetical protein
MSDLAIFTNSIESSDVYEFVEEIYMCIKTKPYEAILDLSAGQANSDFFIGETSLSSERLIDALKTDIANNTNGASKYAYAIDVKFLKGSKRDIVFITISVKDNNGDIITTNYQFN